MKIKLQRFVFSFGVLLLSTLLSSLVLSILYYLHVFSTNTFHILTWICGVFAYGLGGVILGKNIQKKALLSALVGLLVLCIPILFFHDYSMMGLIESASKLGAYGVLCLFVFTKMPSSSV
ncbi:MAG: DUF3792 domain-containing protein [Longicatena sp.]